MTDEALPLEIGVAELHAMRESNAPHVLWDVREEDEYAVAKIDGSRLIPMSSIQDELESLRADADQRIIVQCHHGGRSMRVTRWLRANGFDRVQNLAGGIDAWSQAIDPTVPRY